VQGDERLKQRALQRLISRDPDQFWTSGQWMTEKTGGSDVGRTQTVARSEDGGYRLYGSKWFTSATTSQMTMTLARVEDSDHTTTSGSRGLSLFYLETHDDQGRLNQIEIHRLKDKLGTRSLPTAELTLGGTPAVLLGEPGRGVANIATLINITRVYNAVSAVASMRRGMALARDYARRREVFGRLLAEQPLHVETLADLEVELQGAFQLAFACVRLLGRDECGETDTNQRALLRILTPLAKLYTAKQCVAFMTELLESFGGAGYVEDTGLPRMLRDAQVLSIWEGTTNVLSLDALRAIDKDSAFEPLIEDARRRLADVRNSALTGEVAEVSAALDRLIEYLPRAAAEGVDLLQAGARGFAFSLARTYTATLLLEHAQWQTSNGDARGIAVVRRWLRRDLTPLKWADAQDRAEATALALGVELPLSKTELSPATSARASKEKSTDKKPAMERSPSGGEPTPQSSPVIQPSRVT
jgi:alkylation response protein AidB-like acyl-CoA dehydrogenase